MGRWSGCRGGCRGGARLRGRAASPAFINGCRIRPGRPTRPGGSSEALLPACYLRRDFTRHVKAHHVPPACTGLSSWLVHSSAAWPRFFNARTGPHAAHWSRAPRVGLAHGCSRCCATAPSPHPPRAQRARPHRPVLPVLPLPPAAAEEQPAHSPLPPRAPASTRAQPAGRS